MCLLSSDLFQFHSGALCYQTYGERTMTFHYHHQNDGIIGREQWRYTITTRMTALSGENNDATLSPPEWRYYRERTMTLHYHHQNDGIIGKEQWRYTITTRMTALWGENNDATLSPPEWRHYGDRRTMTFHYHHQNDGIMERGEQWRFTITTRMTALWGEENNDVSLSPPEWRHYGERTMTFHYHHQNDGIKVDTL